MDGSDLLAQLERYQKESYGWAVRCCSQDPAEAETVLQSVYLKILEGKASFDGKAAFKTWLFAVIRRTAAEERRRSIWRRLRLVTYDGSDLGVARAESPDAAVYRSEIEASFQRALATLSRQQRQLLQLVFYHDLTIAEAADVMGISSGAAHAHYERGKKRIRHAMAELEDSYAPGS